MGVAFETSAERGRLETVANDGNSRVKPARCSSRPYIEPAKA